MHCRKNLADIFLHILNDALCVCKSSFIAKFSVKQNCNVLCKLKQEIAFCRQWSTIFVSASLCVELSSSTSSKKVFGGIPSVGSNCFLWLLSEIEESAAIPCSCSWAKAVWFFQNSSLCTLDLKSERRDSIFLQLLFSKAFLNFSSHESSAWFMSISCAFSLNQSACNDFNDCRKRCSNASRTIYEHREACCSVSQSSLFWWPHCIYFWFNRFPQIHCTLNSFQAHPCMHR